MAAHQLPYSSTGKANGEAAPGSFGSLFPMVLRRIALLLVALVLGAGCGGADDTDQGSPPQAGQESSTTNEVESDDEVAVEDEELRPADEIERDDATRGVFYEPTEFGDLRIILSKPVSAGTTGHPTGEGPDVPVWSMKVRIENPSAVEQTSPTIQLLCDGSAADTGYFLVDEGETYTGGEEMPPKSFVEGGMNLYTEHPCETMAIEAVPMFAMEDDAPRAVWEFVP